MKSIQFSGWLGLVCCLVMVGCGPGHRAVPILEAGRDLHLVVNIPNDQVAGARGTLHYSLPAGRPYTSKPLLLQGSNLVATLSTRELGPGQRVEYYFEVYAGGEGKSLGSPQRPYLTKIMDRTEIVLRSIRCDVAHTNAGQPVIFTMDAGPHRVTRAVVQYSPPDLPGFVTQVMTRNGRVWEAKVPAKRVAPGSWTFRIEAVVEGVKYTHPNADGKPGYFNVKK